MKVITVPTGKIIVLDGKYGPLECLSIADYGKDANIKANFLGIDRPIEGVPNGEPLPLSEKWVVTISSQYGCSMKCNFCDVPLVGKGRNALQSDMDRQVATALLIGGCSETKRLNVHYARMGEPTFNTSLLHHAEHRLPDIVNNMGVKCDTIHPVVSTMMPKNNTNLEFFLQYWTTHIKNSKYKGEAGLQLSINSTCDKQRDEMFGGCSLSLSEISEMVAKLPTPVGRKYTLNFALADGYEVDASKLRKYFDPVDWIVKLTPIHLTKSCHKNDIKTDGGYDCYSPYHEVEQQLIEAGFDVLVFIPSLDEDDSLITCGNAILSGSQPHDTVNWKQTEF